MIEMLCVILLIFLSITYDFALTKALLIFELI